MQSDNKKSKQKTAGPGGLRDLASREDATIKRSQCVVKERDEKRVMVSVERHSKKKKKKKRREREINPDIGASEINPKREETPVFK